jgi:DNA-binding transcriptional regulator LsrR (DeoR family)
MVQAAAVAQKFYREGRSKIEIAEELGCSRFKVARILDEALERGLVEVRINLPAQVDPDLSTRLAGRFGLNRAIVVDAADPAPAHEQVCTVAADLLSELVTAEDVLGLSCSRSVTATIDALRRLAPCRVVQLTGTLAGAEHGPGSVESVRRAAEVGRGAAYPIYAPMVLPDEATARALAHQGDISAVMRRFPEVTIALVSVGAWSADSSSVWQTLDDDRLREAATAAGAVGEIGARLFDGDGQAMSAPIDGRVLGVSLEQLRGMNEVIALALGRQRSEAIRASLAGGLVTTLVCDGALARALLEDGRTTSEVAS